MVRKWLTLLCVIGYPCTQAWACSSCGSSATSPLVLQPNENLKLYAGLSENYGYMNYGVYGGSSTTRWSDPFLTTKDILTVALGYRTSERSFITLTSSFVRNDGPIDSNDPTQGNETHYLAGDPILSGRYDLMRLDLENPDQPQVQLVLSYKPKLAKNMVDNDGNAVETTGNGFHQASAGLDVWWGARFIQLGFAQFITYSFTRHPNVALPNGSTDTERSRDLQYTTVLSVGHNFDTENAKLTGGVILDYIGEEDTTLQDSSGNTYTNVTEPGQSNSVFITLDKNLTPTDMVRISYQRGGFYQGNLGPFTNSRQTTSNSILVGYEYTFF